MITESVAEFRVALPARGRLMGCDVGEKTIGLAICDADRRIATPAQTVRRAKWSQDLTTIDQVKTSVSGIDGFVVGLPLNMDGSDSSRTQSVRATARNLAAAFQLPILLWDERWSTAAVERAMIAADVSRAKRAQRVDQAAAAYILQGALDALNANQRV
jgi:putative holliday junction resolvase